MKKKWIVSLVVFLGFLVSGSSATAESINQEIKSIEEPTWLFRAGISKGKYHDRQDLGFILKANTVLKVRQTNSEFKGDLTLRLLSNDSKEEKSVKVNSEWTVVSSSAPTVPFVDTPYGVTGAAIEYQLANEQQQKTLPIFERSGDQTEFFETWDKSDGDFALIKGGSFQLFMPKKDKELVRKLKDFKNLDELIAYYEDVFSKYDQYIGLDNSTSENRKSQNRYFLKADLHGAGGAYYGNNWTANTASTTDMWLKKNNWGSLHEIAHGYQASFKNNGMFTGEVSNNLLAVQYQYETYGKAMDNITWLFNYGKRAEVDEAVYQQIINSGKGYEELSDYRSRLVVLAMLNQKAGKDSLAKMYQEYRKLAADPKFKSADYSLPNLMNKYYSENSKFDFTASLEKLKLNVDSDQGELNRAKGYEAVASLADVVPKSKLAAARKALDPSIQINSNFELVDNKAIKPLGLKGNLTVNFSVDDFSALKGKKVRLKEGNTVIKEETIEKGDLTFTAVPNGVYTIEVMTNIKSGYVSNQHYVYVKEAENNASITLEKIETSNLVDQTVDFLGFDDKKFAEFKTDLNTHQATFSLSEKTPHSYFEGEKYAAIQILDKAGKTIYSKEIEGTNNQVGIDTIPFDVGYKVVIFHAETKTRLMSNENLINKKNKNNTLAMTVFGLEHDELKNNTEADLIKKIDYLGEKITAQKELVDAAISNQKTQLYAAVNSLNEPTKAEYLSKYAHLFGEAETIPEETNQYLFSFKGYGARKFAELDMNLVDDKAMLNIEAGKPFAAYTGEYASLQVQNEIGDIKYKKSFIANTMYQKEQETIEFTTGDYITIKTLGKLTIQNVTTDSMLPVAEQVSYRVLEKELQQVSLEEVPEQDPEAGRSFTYLFRGDKKEIFGSMDVDLKNNLVRINTNEGRTSSFFGSNSPYLSIEIAGPGGSEDILYQRDYVGQTLYKKQTEVVPITLGSFIVVSHRLGMDYVSLTNNTLYVKIGGAGETVYQVTERGLERTE